MKSFRFGGAEWLPNWALCSPIICFRLPMPESVQWPMPGVVATLLPLTAFALKEPYARGREND